jgi:hypothetical protein
MTSLTVLDELVAEIKLQNPDATPEEIYEVIAVSLSKEILPEVVKSLVLPEFPTYRMVELEQSKRLKVKRKSKNDQFANLGQRRSLIQDIERVRTEMGWDGVNNMRSTSFIANSTTLLFEPRRNFPMTRKISLRKPDFKEEFEEKEKETIHSTSQQMPIQTEKDIFTLSETTQRKIVTEPMFEAIFKKVEMQLRGIIINRALQTEIEVVCQSDLEIPSWNKCILKVHPPSTLGFNEKMNISTLFDITIRNVIKSLKETATPEEANYLQDLNRNLFVHIVL